MPACYHPVLSAPNSSPSAQLKSSAHPDSVSKTAKRNERKSVSDRQVVAQTPKRARTVSDEAEARVLQKLTLLKASGEASNVTTQKLHERFSQLAKLKDQQQQQAGKTALSSIDEKKLVDGFRLIEKQIDTERRVQTFASSWFDWF